MYSTVAELIQQNMWRLTKHTDSVLSSALTLNNSERLPHTDFFRVTPVMKKEYFRQ
jgi:hypothetical protein